MKKQTKNENRRILTRLVATPVRTEALKLVTGGMIVEDYCSCGGEGYDQCDG